MNYEPGTLCYYTHRTGTAYPVEIVRNLSFALVEVTPTTTERPPFLLHYQNTFVTGKSSLSPMPTPAPLYAYYELKHPLTGSVTGCGETYPAALEAARQLARETHAPVNLYGITQRGDRIGLGIIAPPPRADPSETQPARQIRPVPPLSTR